MTIRLSEISDKKLRAKIAAIGSKNQRCRRSKSESTQQSALGRTPKTSQGMVDIAGPLLVRIIRIYDPGTARRYDDDNFVAGCKTLRDAIAAALLRKGDSEKDGLWWEYRQEVGEPEIRIEVFPYE